METGETVAIKKVFQDKRYKNRELQIMKELKHSNIVELKHAFYTSGDKPGETYLNVVMEYCSDTVYRVMKHYNKLKQPMPLLYVKVRNTTKGEAADAPALRQGKKSRRTRWMMRVTGNQ